MTTVVCIGDSVFANLKEKVMKVEEMPSVMVSTYVPKIVKTKATQLAFLKGRTRKKSAMESSLPAPYVLMTDHGKDSALWFYVASVDGESLHYLMLLNPIKVVRPDGIKLKSVYQGSVWKSSYMGFIKPDLPSEVFWDFLQFVLRLFLILFNQSKGNHSGSAVCTKLCLGDL